MSERIVINSGPIIAFGRMDAFEILPKLPFEFISPSQVKAEIDAGAALGYPVEFPSYVNVEPLPTPLSGLALANLDSGEAAVIELAIDRGIQIVCIDELKGRRAALALGLRVVGSLGLIGRAKTLGLIERVRPFVERAQISGVYYDNQLLEGLLRDLGE